MKCECLLFLPLIKKKRRRDDNQTSELPSAFVRESYAFATPARPLMAFKLFENEEFGNAFDM